MVGRGRVCICIYMFYLFRELSFFFSDWVYLGCSKGLFSSEGKDMYVREDTEWTDWRAGLVFVLEFVAVRVDSLELDV